MSKMHKITVGLGERSYPIYFGTQTLDNLGGVLSGVDFPKQLAIITNETLAPLYGESLADCLKKAGYKVITYAIPDGEAFKNLQTLQEVFTFLIAEGLDRGCGIVALGGGVVGDLAGFAAATFLRGIPFVQIPTTLLAQVDSSVGGKTAVNHPLGKNLIGAFYQPRLVLADVGLLWTLPQRELIAGLAEVVKYGVIRNAEFFSWLEMHRKQLLERDPEALIHAVKISCQIKANIVENDEKERSLRAILNYGHTFGHAVEQLTGFGSVKHGEAVSIGMVVAARISQGLGFCSANDVDRIVSLLASLDLPVSAPPFPVSKFVEAMTRDKKVQQGILHMVLNRGIGDCLLHQMTDLSGTLTAVLPPLND